MSLRGRSGKDTTLWLFSSAFEVCFSFFHSFHKCCPSICSVPVAGLGRGIFTLLWWKLRCFPLPCALGPCKKSCKLLGLLVGRLHDLHRSALPLTRNLSLAELLNLSVLSFLIFERQTQECGYYFLIVLWWLIFIFQPSLYGNHLCIKLIL